MPTCILQVGEFEACQRSQSDGHRRIAETSTMPRVRSITLSCPCALSSLVWYCEKAHSSM